MLQLTSSNNSGNIIPMESVSIQGSILTSGQRMSLRWANVILSIGPTLAKNYIGPTCNAISV